MASKMLIKLIYSPLTAQSSLKGKRHNVDTQYTHGNKPPSEYIKTSTCVFCFCKM